MTDPVSEELARRAAEPIPWRGALVVAVGLHFLAFAALLLASRPARKALSLPAVKVHLAPMVSVPGPAAAPAGGEPKTEPLKPAAKPAPPPKPAKTTPPAKVAAATKATVGKKADQRPAAVESAGGGSGTAASAPSAGAAGGLGLAESEGEGSPFPYQYYLERVLGAIEQNWFKPPAPPGTRCRVRCRIGRSGELKEAGLEEPSGVGAFDRAALRAVYAAAPFPPLPQGFGGSELILHLEFVE
ncbi:hypothetical protein HRbin09_01560 [bacterium HR09]|nr:hypothetical protein HRbin09_01560 [bacterium HR09]